MQCYVLLCHVCMYACIHTCSTYLTDIIYIIFITVEDKIQPLGRQVGQILRVKAVKVQNYSTQIRKL